MWINGKNLKKNEADFWALLKKMNKIDVGTVFAAITKSVVDVGEMKVSYIALWRFPGLSHLHCL